MTPLSEEAGSDAEQLCQAGMKGAAHLTLTASQLARQRGYFLTTLGDHTPPEQQNCPAHLKLGLGTLSTSTCPFQRDPPSLRTRLPLSTPMGIRIWWLQGEAQHRRDSAAGSSFAVTAGPAEQWVPVLTWEGWQEHRSRHRRRSRRESKHPTGKLCGPNTMVKQLPVGQRLVCLELISEHGEVLLFLADLQFYL